MMSISLYSHIGQQAGLLLILADFLLMISNSIEYRHHKSGDIKKKQKSRLDSKSMEYRQYKSGDIQKSRWGDAIRPICIYLD